MDNINKLMDKAMRILDDKGVYNIVGDDSHIEADCEDGEVLYHLVLDGHVGNLDDITCDCGEKVCAHRLAFVLELNRKMENSKLMMLDNAFNGALSQDGLRNFIELAINYNEDLYHYFLDMILFEEAGGVGFSGDQEYERLDQIFHKYSQTGFIFQKNYQNLAQDIKDEFQNYVEYPEHHDEFLAYVLKMIAQYQYDRTEAFYPAILPVLSEIADGATVTRKLAKKTFTTLMTLLENPSIIIVEALIYELLFGFVTAKNQARQIANFIKPRIANLIELIEESDNLGEPQDLTLLRLALNQINLHVRTLLGMSAFNTFSDYFKILPPKYLYSGVGTLVGYYAFSEEEDALDELIEFLFSRKLELMNDYEKSKEIIMALIGAINDNWVYDNEYYIALIIELMVENYDEPIGAKMLWEFNLMQG